MTMIQIEERNGSSNELRPPRAPGEGWSGTYAYVHFDVIETDKFITECIVPEAERLMLAGKASSWFFLRYWHGGPHLRIRFRDVDAKAHAEFESRLADWLGNHPTGIRAVERESFRAHFGTADPEPWHEHGEVARAEYLPETERYGGAAALAACEEVFHTSSRIAAAVLSKGDRSAVLLAGLDLMMTALSATGGHALDAVRSARRYFASWDFVDESSSDAHTAWGRAEAIRRSNPEAWSLRSAQVEHVVRTQPATTHGLWHRTVQNLMSTLEKLQAGAGLGNDPMNIFWSVIHMMNNRLGLSIGDERAISWLASRVHPGWNPPVGFFDDALDAPDRGYLEASKYERPLMGTDQSPLSHAGTGHRRPQIARPALRLPDIGGLGSRLDLALHGRSSGYGDFGGVLGVEDLSTLLGHAVGMAPGRRVELPGKTLNYRTYPSPSAAYPTQVVLVAWEVDGLTSGTYKYTADTHSLEPLGSAPARENLDSWSPFFSSAQEPPVPGAMSVHSRTLPAMLVLVGDLGMLRERYGLRALRLILAESGHMAQNIALCAAALGVKSLPLAGFADDPVNIALHLDGIDSAAVAILPLGREPAAS